MCELSIYLNGLQVIIKLAVPTPEQRETWIKEYGSSKPVEIYEVIIPGKDKINNRSILSLPGKEALLEFLKSLD